MEVFLLTPIMVAILAGISASTYIFRFFTKDHNWLNLGMAIPRIFLCGIYLWFSTKPELPIETTRVWGRDSVAFLFIVEIVYWLIYIIAYHKGKKDEPQPITD
jgi:hypothetical protein